MVSGNWYVHSIVGAVILTQHSDLQYRRAFRRLPNENYYQAACCDSFTIRNNKIIIYPLSVLSFCGRSIFWMPAAARNRFRRVLSEKPVPASLALPFQCGLYWKR